MKKAYKSGRLTNGEENGKGYIVHLVPDLGWSKAFCGTKPGKRSAIGWCETEKEVTCEKCLKRDKNELST